MLQASFVWVLEPSNVVQGIYVFVGNKKQRSPANNSTHSIIVMV